MAFEETNTAGFKTYLTKYGVTKLLQPNTNFDIKYFCLSDDGVNYGETVDTSVLVTSVNGEDIKTMYNGSDDISIIGTKENTQDEIAKREIVFIDDCNDSEYKNVDITFNLGNYLKSLRETNSNTDGVSRGYESFISLSLPYLVKINLTFLFMLTNAIKNLKLLLILSLLHLFFQ